MPDVGRARAKGQKRTDLEHLDWIGGASGRFAAFPLGDGEGDPVIVVVEYAPGTVIPSHHHESDYFSMVLRGDIEITRRRESPGSMRYVRATTVYGPLVVGPEGCTVLEVFADRRTFVDPRYVPALPSAPASVGTSMPELFAQAIAQAVSTFDGAGGNRGEPGDDD